MQLVIADTGPLNYLIQTGDIELLPKLFEEILVPQSVRDELSSDDAPTIVRTWIANAPNWMNVRPNPKSINVGSKNLDEGESAAIELAIAIKADLILMDDRDGVIIARQKGFAVIGTLGVFDLAAQQGMLDLAEAFARLKKTNFYYRQGLLDDMLAKHGQKRKKR